jgi:hypothetical protein
MVAFKADILNALIVSSQLWQPQEVDLIQCLNTRLIQILREEEKNGIKELKPISSYIGIITLNIFT